MCMDLNEHDHSGTWISSVHRARRAVWLSLFLSFWLWGGYRPFGSPFRSLTQATGRAWRGTRRLAACTSSDDFISSWEGSSSASSMARNTRSCYRMFRRALIVERLTLQQMLDHGRRPSICRRSNCTGGASWMSLILTRTNQPLELIFSAHHVWYDSIEYHTNVMCISAHARVRSCVPVSLPFYSSSWCSLLFSLFWPFL